MRRPLELYPEDVELHRTEHRALRRADHRRRATVAPAEDIPAGTTAHEYNQYWEFRANDLARLELLSRSNQMSLTSVLTVNTPSPPLGPASPIESSNSSVEDVLPNHRLTAMEFSQADFDSWYNYQSEDTRALVSYADYQHYALHGSGPPYGVFPARSMRHISHNSILRVNIFVRGVANIGSFDLDPVQCQTMYEFVHTLETAVLDPGIWRHPETGQEVEAPELQGGILYLGHFPVGGSRVFCENIQLVMGIDGPGAILWEFWWKLNFEFGRRDVLVGRVEVERADQ